MAKALKAENVTTLPARAAKGAGGSKPRNPKAKLPPAIPAAKGAKKAGAAPQPGATVDTDTSVREAAQLKLIGWRQRHRDLDNKIDVLKGELKELNTQKKEVRTAIQTVIPLRLFDEAYEDAGTSRVDLDKKESLRTLVREAYGLSVAPQGDMLKDVPVAVQPAVYWEAEGYKDGIAGKDPKAPDGCPPENGPDYMRGYSMGQARNTMGLKTLKADGSSGPGLTAEEAASAAAGGDAEGEEEDQHNGDEPIDEGAAEASAVPDTGIEKLDEWAKDGGKEKPADDFEASEDEFNAQSGRRAIQERRDSEMLN